MKIRSLRSPRSIALAAGLCILAAGVWFGVRFWNYKRDIAQIRVQNVDMNTVPDGEYFGDCDAGFVAAKVRVAVAGRRITEVRLLEHDNGRGAPAEVIPGRIVSEQRIDVDAVTGATASSKVIQEAVYNALTGKRTI